MRKKYFKSFFFNKNFKGVEQKKRKDKKELQQNLYW